MLPRVSPTTRASVTFVASITNIFLTLIITSFGYLISGDVRDIQAHADQRAKAKELQEFWGEMHLASQRLDEQSKHYGESIMKFSTASGQLLEEYDRIYRSGRFDSFNSDPKYIAAYANFIGSYGEALALVTSVRKEFAFLRVRYAAIAATHNIAGWAKFTSQDKVLFEWSSEVHAQLDKTAGNINSVVSERKDPAPMFQAFIADFAQLGGFLVTKPIPYARGLDQFLDANWKSQSAVVVKQ